ncbi:splicing factor, Prp19-binding domain-containing protein [Trametes maxima]|nr:splicing factor, Prp19-binding domain-containing protein [Trametes maxima]
MSSAARKPAARLPRPAARYWKGKAPKGADAAESESDYDEGAEEQEPQEEGDELIRDVGGDEEGEGVEEEEDGLEVRRQKAVGRPARGAINVSLRDVNISREGKVIVGGKEESGRTAAELEDEEEETDEEEEEEAAEDEEESSEEESESEEEEKPKLQFRPVFVPKYVARVHSQRQSNLLKTCATTYRRARVTIAEKEAMAEDSEEALKRKEAEAEERRKASHDMVAESIRRELLEKEKEEEVPDVDDTDGLDPAAEFEAWRLRELARIKRDKEADLARERERDEIERRRALPEEQRLKEDLERAEKLRADKPKGQQQFLQKYWHKGAFHQDDEVLRRHDYTERTESTVDVSLLPKVMQVRNFGKRGRTKYTHLLDQDTTAAAGGFGGTGSVKAGGTSTAGGGGCFLCGGPHLKKDCPQNANLPPGKAATGANSAPTGFRPWGARDDARGSWRDRDQDRDGDDDRRPGGGGDDDRDRGRDDAERARERERERNRARDRERYYRDDREGGRVRDGDRDRDRGRDRGDGGRARDTHADRERRRHHSRSPRRSRPRVDSGDARRDRRRSRSRSADYAVARDEKRRRVE